MVTGGRAGCRSIETALAVARAVKAGGLSLRGVEGFEGILADAAAVDSFLDLICEAAIAIDREKLFVPDRPVILTAGGSAYYDRVAARLGGRGRIAGEVKIVSRSGCYLTHDSGSYAAAYAALRERDPTLPETGFTPVSAAVHAE